MASVTLFRHDRKASFSSRPRGIREENEVIRGIFHRCVYAQGEGPDEPPSALQRSPAQCGESGLLRFGSEGGGVGLSHSRSSSGPPGLIHRPYTAIQIKRKNPSRLCSFPSCASRTSPGQPKLKTGALRTAACRARASTSQRVPLRFAHVCGWSPTRLPCPRKLWSRASSAAAPHRMRLRGPRKIGDILRVTT